jgi:hypothetical protein
MVCGEMKARPETAIDVERETKSVGQDRDFALEVEGRELERVWVLRLCD